MSETTTYTFVGGITATMKLEANNSTTINFKFPGGISYSWNSGVYMACALIGSGTGLAVTVFSKTPAVGSLTSLLVAKGCTYVVSQDQGSGGGGGGDGQAGGGNGGGDGGDMKLPDATPEKKGDGYWQKPGFGDTSSHITHDQQPDQMSHPELVLVGVPELMPAY